MKKGFNSISHAWNIIVWFFLGSVVSIVAFDWSDYANYLAQASGKPLGPFQQAFYFTIFPTILYLVLAIVAYLIARSKEMTPAHFVEAFFILIVLLPAFLIIFLPQTSNYIFDLTVLGGVITAGFISLDLLHSVKKKH